MSRSKFLFQELPNNIYAERYILGSILVDTETIAIVSQRLKVEAFYLNAHQILYKGALILYGENQKIDYITLTTWLQDHNYQEHVNEISKVSSFFNQVFGGNNIEDYIALVYEKYLRRCLIEFGVNIINQSYVSTLSVEDVFLKVQQEFFAITKKKKEKTANSSAEILAQVVKEIKRNLQNSGSSSLTTSFHELDTITQGFQKSDLIIVAGRPSMGKTAFSLNLAREISLKHKVGILFFSLEMTQQQLMYRLLATETKIDNSRLRSGCISKSDWDKISKAIKNLSNLKLFIDDTSNLKVDQIYSKIVRLEQDYREKFSLIIIDYLQLIEESAKADNRAQELSKITRNLKKLARELNLPILVLSQLSRNVDSRINKRPLLSDLRESGCFGFAPKFKLFFDKCSELKLLTVLSWTGKKLIRKKIDKITITGQKPLYQLSTNLGWNILLTGDHNIYTKGGWKKTAGLTKNNFILAKLLFSFLSFSKKKKNFLSIGKIISLSYCKVTSVYDLQISCFSNFISNRLLIHNSIEQDADVVMMLYRDEYYNVDTKEKNIIEIIVAKHRQGALGTAKLEFDPKHLCFCNKNNLEA